jgi:hypothetical protein
MDGWKDVAKHPNLKTEDMVLLNWVDSLSDAAKTAAKRLNLNAQETQALVDRYIGYTKELSGPGVKPVPPIIYFSARGERDMTVENYNKILPMFAAMKPAPKVSVVPVGAGVHYDTSIPEKDLPQGIAPAIAKYWYDAIKGGYFY